MRAAVIVLAAALAALAPAAGCLSKGDTEVTSSGADETQTCTTVCQHLSAETFGDCAKWTDYQDCIFECEDHRPTQEGLRCAAAAGTCEDFRQCDSTYDLF